MPAELREIPCEPPGASVIERLEFALKMARDGDISAVAIVWVSREGCVGSTYSKLHSYPTMLGALDMAAHKIRIA